MKPTAEQQAFYAAYHRNKWNVATHFVGIPAIIIGLLAPMGWARIDVSGMPISGALAFVGAVAVYYLLLDVRLALAISVFIVPAFYAADTISRMPWLQSMLWFPALFAGGWIFQLIGHSVFEKGKPAFVDNLIQLLIGPLFLVAKVIFFLGLRKPLQQAISLYPSPFAEEAEQAWQGSKFQSRICYDVCCSAWPNGE